MTHSYPLMQEEFDCEPETEAEREIKKYTEAVEAGKITSKMFER